MRDGCTPFEHPMQTHVEFRSDRFPPAEGEEAEVNPGRHGKRLAEFLRRGLRERGFDAGDPVAEDWGWLIPIGNEPFPLSVGCGNYEEYPADGFLCFIEPHTPTIRRWFRNVDTTARVAALRMVIDAVLSAPPGVRDKRWWTHDEFNAPDPTV
jgi:hypothetical protein